MVIVSAGELIPGDGEVIEGIASVDESAITGESAPVIRESGGDRSAVTGGTKVLSDQIRVQITSEPRRDLPRPHDRPGRGRRAAEDAQRDRPDHPAGGPDDHLPLVVVTLEPFAIYAGAPQSPTVLIALLVCLIPTTIGGLLSAIGIAGMDRLVRHNVLAMSGRAVEAAGDVDTLLLDKTGTITLGNRQAAEFIPMPGVTEAELADAAQLASLADETPEGRSIVVLAKSFGIRGRAHRPREGELHPVQRPDPHERRRPGRPVASARAPATRSSPGSASAAAPCRPSSSARSSRSRCRAARRWPWPATTRRSASST